MTIFENALIKVIQKRCRHEDWWIFNSPEDLREYWRERRVRVDPTCRFYAVYVNDSELNITGFDALSEHPDIDLESAIIMSSSVEGEYEQMFFGQ